MRAAQQEAEDQLRSCPPSFDVAAMTTLGQFGDRFEMLIETIVHQRELTLADEGPRMDGKSPFQVILEFRQDFQDGSHLCHGTRQCANDQSSWPGAKLPSWAMEKGLSRDVMIIIVKFPHVPLDLLKIDV